MSRRITRLCAILATGVQLPSHVIPTRQPVDLVERAKADFIRGFRPGK